MAIEFPGSVEANSRKAEANTSGGAIAFDTSWLKSAPPAKQVNADDYLIKPPSPVEPVNKSGTTVKATEIRDSVLKHFPNMDSDNSGEVSKTELTAFVAKSPSLPKIELDSLNRAISKFDTLNAMNVNTFGNMVELRGELAPSDVVRFAEYHQQLKVEQQGIDSALLYMNANFQVIDKDHNGVISPQELHQSAAMTEELQAVTHFDEIQRASNDTWGNDKGITQKDIMKYKSDWNNQYDFYRDMGVIQFRSEKSINYMRPTKAEVLTVSE
jgi:Ca2+-binding EF-hand superfamily protein